MSKRYKKLVKLKRPLPPSKTNAESALLRQNKRDCSKILKKIFEKGESHGVRNLTKWLHKNKIMEVKNSFMEVFCTYCSKDKTDKKGEIPAIDRYLSQRIRSVYASALSVGHRFYILSGKHGLISASRPILFYDHLLKVEGVAVLSKIVVEQLQTEGVSKLFYFTKNYHNDEKLECYHNVAERACNAASVKFEVLQVRGNR